MIRTTSDERFLNAVVGNDGEISIGSRYEQMLDGANSKKRNCFVQVIESWLSLAMESTKAVARLVNINDGRTSSTTTCSRACTKNSTRATRRPISL